MKTVPVHIGEIKIAKNNETLTALLGSCVGIGILWKSHKIYGLAHCLLPVSPKITFNIGGRFVNQAIPSLLALMKIKQENYAEIEAVVAGGGNMTNPNATSTCDLVGAQNYEAAITELKKLGIRITVNDVGGQIGRKITIQTHDGSVHVEKIPRIAEVS